MVQRLLLVLLLALSSHAGAKQQSNNKQQHTQPRNRRRYLQSATTGNGKFDPQKDHLCWDSDGGLVAPDEILNGGPGKVDGGGDLGIVGGYGGGRRLRPVRRILQQGGGGGGGGGGREGNLWDLCEDIDEEESSDDDDDDDALHGGNGGNVTAPIGDPVDASASVAPSTDATHPSAPADPIPSPTTAPPTPTPSPGPTTKLPTPYPVTAPPTRIPTLSPSGPPYIPRDFWDPDIRNTIFCQVSVALPAFSRRDRTLRGIDDEERELRSTSHHSDSDDEQRQEKNRHNAANRFKEEVGAVMIDIIMNATNYTVVKGPNSIRHRREEEGFTFPLSSLLGDKALLVISRTISNVEAINDNEFIDHHGARWWLYTIALHSIYQDDMFETIKKTVMDSTESSIMTGDFFERLRKRYARVVAVSRAGEEGNSGDLRSVDDDQSPPSEVFDVRYWDASRWVGLGLFALTIMSTLTLTRTAQHRRKKVQEQEDWGVGLATENGINKLLTYGWEYDGATNQVHAFDKSKLVYRDDDSMLIGGAYPLQYAGSQKAAPTEAVTSSQNTQGSPTERSPSSRDDPSSGSPSSRGPSSGMGDSGQSLGYSSRLGEF